MLRETKEKKNISELDKFIPEGQFKDLLIGMKKYDTLGIVIERKHFTIKRDE